MLKAIMLSAAALLISGTAVAAGLSGVEAPDTRRAPVSEIEDGADRPCAPIKVVIPARNVGPKDNSFSGTQVIPGSDVVAAPAAEVLMVPPEERQADPATFFGMTAKGKVVWVLDRSGSMGLQDPGLGAVEDHNGNTIQNPTRLQVVKAEVSRALVKMTEEDKYAIVFFGGYPQTSATPTLVTANAQGVQQGLQRLSTTHAGYNTPTQLGLNIGLTQYGIDITNFFFLSDGTPTSGMTATEIISWFPGASQALRDNGCRFSVTHMGQPDTSRDFMQSLANSVNAEFFHR